MSESSLPHFGSTGLRHLLKWLKPSQEKAPAEPGLRRDREAAATLEPPSPLDPRSERAVRGYLDAHAPLLERAARLSEKAERLERAGTPSESARNRAERARAEVSAGLASLKARFVEDGGNPEWGCAFDRAVEKLYPVHAGAARRL